MSTANFSKLLRWNVIRRPEKEALVDGERHWSYAELDGAVDRTAHALRTLGADRGTIVALLARNSAEYVIELLAIARLGAVLLPLNCRLHERELEYIVGHAGASIIIADEEFAESARALAELPEVTQIALHGKAQAVPDAADITALAAAAESTPYPDAAVSFGELSRIMYTSGTTSHPKGVMTTWGNIAANQLGQILELELSGADRVLTSGPLFHVASLEAPGYHVLSVGGTIVIARSFGARELLELTSSQRVTGIVLPGAIALDIVRFDDFEQFDLDALRYMILGWVPPELHHRLMERLPNVRLIHTFGMTELTNGVAYMDRLHMREKLGSSGTPFLYTEIAIHDEDGAPAPADTPGEIVVRGPKVTPGYWRDPVATEAAWRDGWFHTGDIGRIDADGYLWFMDRIKDMIRSGGENMASAEIERVLITHPAIAEAAVIGVPHPKWGETPYAFLVSAHAEPPNDTDLIQFCSERLARFKVPRQYEWVPSLPHNASNKVLKRELRSRVTQIASALPVLEHAKTSP